MKRTPLKSSPEQVRAWQQRSRRRISRTKAMPKWNPERLARLREKQFGDVARLVRLLPCAVCSKPGPNHPHHVKSRGAGGDSEALVALCALHHDLVHTLGRETFARKYDVDLAEVAREQAG